MPLSIRWSRIALNTVTKIQSIRRQINDHRATRRSLEQQARSREEVARAVGQRVAGWRTGYTARNRQALSLMAAGQHPPLIARQVLHPNDLEAVFGEFLVAVLGAEAVERALLSEIDAVPLGVPKAERAARIAELDAALDALEIEEETLIERAEDAGEVVYRRADARPEIVLGSMRRDPAL